MRTLNSLTSTIILLSLTVAGHLNTIAQEESVVEQIANTFRSNDSRELSGFFSEAVDMEIPGSEGAYSKTQAEMIIKDFFTVHPCSAFQVNHQGTSQDGSRYFIGTYTSSGVQFRVYGLLKTISGKLLIQQLQIEED
ncbi:MAG: DUF4783 domain-containing protein [Bacteroidales bacterium]|nr:DUF4783 domain-containing protein [Bacteroidales bacterium]